MEAILPRKKHLAVSVQRWEEVLLASNEERSEMLLNILQITAQPHNTELLGPKFE